MTRDGPVTAPISNLEDHLGYWLRFVSNHVSDAFRRKVETHGVTVAEWVVLRELWTVGAARPSQLAEKLGLSRGAISKLVQRIVQKGLARCDVGDAARVTEGIATFQISDFPEQARNIWESRNGHVNMRDRLFTKDRIPH